MLTTLKDLDIGYIPAKNQALIEWKKQGKKAIGYFCQSFPKEIIYAGDILPINILGDSSPIEQGNEFWTRYACYFSRSVVDLALKGELDPLDGVVFIYTCDIAHFLNTRWQHIPSQKDKFCYYLTHPVTPSAGAKELFTRELFEFRKALESHFKVWISNDSLLKAIEIYNENRALLREIDSLKKKGMISGVEAAKATFTSMLTPPEKNNEFLRTFIEEVKQKRKPTESDQVKLFVSGAMLPSTEFFELIEEEGGIVIADDLCIGSRYSRGTISTDKEPLTALAEYYLAENEIQWQCPSMVTEGRLERRLQYIEETVKNYGVQGVILCIPIYCDPHCWDRVCFVEHFQKNNIPVLIVDQEGSMKSEALRTRVAAFIETIRR